MNNNNLDAIKAFLMECKGKKVFIKLYKQRKKSIARAATVVGVYPHVFVVQLAGGNRRMSFCYADLFTKTVEIIAA